MTRLLNIAATHEYLKQFATENEISVAFVCNPEGGMICSSDLTQDRMAVEALSTIWHTLLPPGWKKMFFEWETAYVVLINCGSCIFGLEQKDQDPSKIGLLHCKAKVCADRIKAQLEP